MTSVDWERTGTRTSVSAGKRKLKMKSIGRSTTTVTYVSIIRYSSGKKHVEGFPEQFLNCLRRYVGKHVAP